jgi:hypothetical protein
MPEETDPRSPPNPFDILQMRLSERTSSRGAPSVIYRWVEIAAPARGFQPRAFTCRFRDALQEQWSMTERGYLFGINKGIVHQICSTEKRDFEAHIGHPDLLSAKQELKVIEYIVTSFRCHCPVSPKQICVF